MADLGLAAKTRPVVIVSRHDTDLPRALILYVPMTTQNRQSPYEVALPRLGFLDRDSVANVQGLGSLPKARLERSPGKLPDEVTRIKLALAVALDFGMDASLVIMFRRARGPVAHPYHGIGRLLYLRPISAASGPPDPIMTPSLIISATSLGRTEFRKKILRALQAANTLARASRIGAGI